jgi:hypothetical protein
VGVLHVLLNSPATALSLGETLLFTLGTVKFSVWSSSTSLSSGTVKILEISLFIADGGSFGGGTAPDGILKKNNHTLFTQFLLTTFVI